MIEEKTFSIGRRSSCSIRLGHSRVSAKHAELVVVKNGKVHITDWASTNGCYYWDGKGWIGFRQHFFSTHDKVKFGEHEVIISELLSSLGGFVGKFSTSGVKRVHVKADNRPSGQKVRRNPDTGEPVADSENN